MILELLVFFASLFFLLLTLGRKKERTPIYLGKNYKPTFEYVSDNLQISLKDELLIEYSKNELDLLPYKDNQFEYIDTEATFDALITALLKERVLGIDLQNSRSTTYHGHLSIIQIASCSKLYILDTMSIPQPILQEKLQMVFQNPTIIKVLHGCYQDLMWLHRDFGLKILNLCDTQRLYMEVRNIKENPSITVLWDNICNFKMSKSQKQAFQQSEWADRPLSKEQLNYAAKDAYYLIYIRAKLLQEAIQKEGSQKTLKMMKRMQSMSERVSAEPRMMQHYSQAFSKAAYKHEIGKEKVITQYYFKEIYAWRERMAARRNIALKKVIENGGIYLISLKRLKSRKQIEELHFTAGFNCSETLLMNMESLIKTLKEIDYNLSTNYQQIKASIRQRQEQKGAGPQPQQLKRLERKEERRKHVIKNFRCQNPVYQNCVMMAPDGELLCHCDQKKAAWYVSRDLAVIVKEDPLTIKLKFEPNGRGVKTLDDLQNNNFYLETRENKCVVCGNKQDYLRHHVVPSLYRHHFPEQLKSHRSHDIVLLCFNCHQVCNRHTDALKKQLSQLYKVPLLVQNEPKARQNQLRVIKKHAKSLISGKLPEKRASQVREIIGKFIVEQSDNLQTLPIDFLSLLEQKDNQTNIDENGEQLKEQSKQENSKWILSQNILNYCCSIQLKKLTNKEKRNSHGVELLSKVEDLTEFIRLWRTHFVSTMKPKYLPQNWRIDHGCYRSFGVHSKFYSDEALERENKEKQDRLIK